MLLASDNRRKSALIFPNVQRIAILRPGAVGDFLFALPALAALHAAYPRAHLTLLGSAWQAEFLQERLVYLDEVVVLPPIRGVGAPSDILEDDAAISEFVAHMQARRFDLAIQMAGGGRYSNPFVRRLGARHCIGLHSPDADPLERSLPYTYLQNERLRLLETVGLAGAQVVTLDPRLPVLPRDLVDAARTVPDDGRPLVVLQPGATDARRRWPAEAFAAVGDALARAGARVVVNGTDEERHVVGSVVAAMHEPALDLSGRLSLSGLCGLLSRATLLVSNDTGPLHLAHALRVPCVGIYWLTNLAISAPLTQERHRAVLAVRTRCPVCGKENITTRCTHNPSFVADVPVNEVLNHARALFEQHRPRLDEAARAGCTGA